ncbi:hypothetical protein [Rubellicoccus peritrichatus]|uniref:Lipoprotein n=1 Tax=Rubellicoccus peritrichatus TaxID=3080537 RepID=A0AAQ3LIJ6_9BACT|nr:hypothetical protein [Puniceicoccus sp. CR14]WOO42769.1 hypothetical protein RZN69_06670 [Puniceicoccus sp. CR14]
MKNYLILLLLAVTGCSDNSSNDAKVSATEEGKSNKQIVANDGNSVGLFPMKAGKSTLEEVDQLGDFKKGQVWTYKTRKGEENSRITILRLEESPKVGGIVHIRVSGLKIPNPNEPDGFTEEAGHLPFSLKAATDSVREVESTAEVDQGYINGYEKWRSAFDQGKAGVFTTSVSDGIGFMAGTIQQANGKPNN